MHPLFFKVLFMKKIVRILDLTEKIICGTGFILLVLLVFISAILRFFRVSMSWNIDLAMLLLAWTSFLGADIAWRHGQLIGIDILTRHLPSVVQKILSLIIYVIIFFLTCVICYYGARLVWVERLRTYQSMPIPYSVVTLSLVVATFSMALSTIGKIKNVILSFRTKEDGVEVSE